MIFKNRLIKLMDNTNTSQAELARFLKFSPQAISKKKLQKN